LTFVGVAGELKVDAMLLSEGEPGVRGPIGFIMPLTGRSFGMPNVSGRVIHKDGRLSRVYCSL
jgi:hypothetical protein